MTMQTYVVTYALAASEADVNESNVNFGSSTDRNNLVMEIQAMYPNQAQLIVESMFGGPSRCYVKSAYPKF